MPSPDQLSLFEVDESLSVDKVQPTEEAMVIASHTRKKRGRKALAENLPRIDIIHDISEEKMRCGCGQIKSRIGEDVSEKLDYIPAQMRVERHIRLKYACKNCEGVEDDGPTVEIAPAPVQLIPKRKIRFWNKPFKPTFEEAKYSMLNCLSPEMQKSIYKSFVFESGRAAAEIGFWMFDVRQSTKVDEKRISAPMLILSGSRDRIMPHFVIKQIAQKYRSVATYKNYIGHSCVFR